MPGSLAKSRAARSVGRPRTDRREHHGQDDVRRGRARACTRGRGSLLARLPSPRLALRHRPRFPRTPQSAFPPAQDEVDPADGPPGPSARPASAHRHLPPMPTDRQPRHSPARTLADVEEAIHILVEGRRARFPLEHLHVYATICRDQDIEASGCDVFHLRLDRRILACPLVCYSDVQHGIDGPR